MTDEARIARLEKLADKWQERADSLRAAINVPGSICYGNKHAEGRADGFAWCAEELREALKP